MQCEEARELASAAQDRELDTASQSRLDLHVATCAACQGHPADLSVVSDAIARHAAPALSTEFRSRLAAVLEEEETRGGNVPDAPRQPPTAAPWVRQFAALAAACVLTAFVTWWAVSSAYQAGAVENELVATHIRSLLQDSPVQVASSSRHTVKPWFAGRTDVAPEANDFPDQGYTLAGGRIDYVDGHRAAVLVYKHAAHVINVFVWADHGRPSLVPTAASRNGYQLLRWSEGGVSYWAVSDTTYDELEALRRLLTSAH